jgi:hypothetical protein
LYRVSEGLLPLQLRDGIDRTNFSKFGQKEARQSKYSASPSDRVESSTGLHLCGAVITLHLHLAVAVVDSHQSPCWQKMFLFCQLCRRELSLEIEKVLLCRTSHESGSGRDCQLCRRELSLEIEKVLLCRTSHESGSGRDSPVV